MPGKLPLHHEAGLNCTGSGSSKTIPNPVPNLAGSGVVQQQGQKRKPRRLRGIWRRYGQIWHGDKNRGKE